jgi:hypothetical protein
MLTVNGDQTSGTNTLPISANSMASFSGTWSGAHTITACNGTGSMQDLACSANRGAFPVGSNMQFSATLQQVGNSVTGIVSLGGLVGSASGHGCAGSRGHRRPVELGLEAVTPTSARTWRVTRLPPQTTGRPACVRTRTASPVASWILIFRERRGQASV